MKIIPPLKALLSLCLFLCLLAATPGIPAKPPLTQKELIKRFDSLIIPDLPDPVEGSIFQIFIMQLSAISDIYKAQYGEPLPVFIDLSAAKQLAKVKEDGGKMVCRAINMPLSVAMNFCTELADLEYKLDGGRIIIYPEAKKDKP